MTTEASLLRAIAQSTSELEQARLIRQLDDLRARRVAERDSDRALDFNSERPQPKVVGRAHSTISHSSDWMLDLPTSEKSNDHKIRAEATLWFQKVSEEVKEDLDEFTEQAEGQAEQVASQYGTEYEAVLETYMSQVARLYREKSSKKVAVQPEVVPVEFDQNRNYRLAIANSICPKCGGEVIDGEGALNNTYVCADCGWSEPTVSEQDREASKTAVSADWQKGYDDAFSSEWVDGFATSWDESMNGNYEYGDGFNAGTDAADEQRRGQPRGDITVGDGFAAFSDPDDFLDAWLSRKTAVSWEQGPFHGGESEEDWVAMVGDKEVAIFKEHSGEWKWAISEDELYGGDFGTREEAEADLMSRLSSRTAGVYCKSHDVWVGDGNDDTHEGCSKEQRATEKTKDARKTAAEMVTDDELAPLKAEFDEAFAALKASGLEHDADDPIAERYRKASDAVNHANRSRDFAIMTGQPTDRRASRRVAADEIVEGCIGCIVMGGTLIVIKAGCPVHDDESFEASRNASRKTAQTNAELVKAMLDDYQNGGGYDNLEKSLIELRERGFGLAQDALYQVQGNNGSLSILWGVLDQIAESVGLDGTTDAVVYSKKAMETSHGEEVSVWWNVIDKMLREIVWTAATEEEAQSFVDGLTRQKSPIAPFLYVERMEAVYEASRKTAVSQFDANKVLEAVKQQFSGYIQAGYSGPQLIMDWDWMGDGPSPAIVWEDGPYEWTYSFPGPDIDEEATSLVQEFEPGRVINYQGVSIPDSVFVEPITSWAIGLYNA